MFKSHTHPSGMHRLLTFSMAFRPLFFICSVSGSDCAGEGEKNIIIREERKRNTIIRENVFCTHFIHTATYR